MTSIFLTGSSGYLGSNLIQHLRKDKNIILHLGVRSPSLNAKDENLFLLESSSNYEQITKNIDCVIHLAGANFKASQNDIEYARRCNLDATISLFRASQLNNVKHFIFASTAHVYGSPLKGNLTETSDLNPVSNYALTKAKAENQLQNEQKGTQVTILRLANIVGPPISKESCDWNLLVNFLCKNIFLTKSLQLSSNGNGFRNFLSVEDFNQSLKQIILNRASLEHFDIINLGGKKNYKVKDIAEIISEEYEKISDVKLKPLFGSAIDATDEDFIYSIEKAQKLNLSCNRDIREEIKKMLIFCNKEFNNV